MAVSLTCCQRKHVSEDFRISDALWTAVAGANSTRRGCHYGRRNLRAANLGVSASLGPLLMVTNQDVVAA